MKKENIVMLKLIGQEFIVGEKINEDNNTITLENARDFQVQMTRDGVSIILPPIFPFAEIEKKPIIVYKNQILVLANCDELDVDIINAYMSQISGLDLTSAKKSKLVVPKI